MRRKKAPPVETYPLWLLEEKGIEVPIREADKPYVPRRMSEEEEHREHLRTGAPKRCMRDTCTAMCPGRSAYPHCEAMPRREE